MPLIQSLASSLLFSICDPLHFSMLKLISRLGGGGVWVVGGLVVLVVIEGGRLGD